MTEPPDSRYRRAAIELASEELDGQLSLHVTGYSMMPLLRPGDVVKAQPVEPDRLRRGDLVVVRLDKGLVTHRLVAMDAHGWYTKGDNCRCADPPVTSQAILGRVVAIQRSGISMDLQSHWWMVINRWLGWWGHCEARLFEQGRQIADRTGVSGGKLRSFAACLAAVPFCLMTRLTWLLARRLPQ